MADFAGKVAFVTGAGTGIGAATAELLAARGAKVAVVGIEQATIDRTVATITANGGEAIPLRVDVSDAAALAAAVDAVKTRWGALHLAVNNAGVSGVSAPVGELSPEDWHRVNSVNYDGVFYGLRYQLPAIEASGGGAVVVVGSMYGTRALPTRAGYTAAKHGVIGLVRTAAVDYATRGVRVNAVLPGVVDTPLLDSGRDQSEQIAAMIPMRRLGQPRELAGAIAFMLSDDASYITGASLGVDGGITA